MGYSVYGFIGIHSTLQLKHAESIMSVVILYVERTLLNLLENT